MQGFKKALVVFVLALIGAVSLWYMLSLNTDEPKHDEAESRRDALALLPVPEGAQASGPPVEADSPPTITRSWQHSESVDKVCASWRESFRKLSGGTGTEETGTISGEFHPGESCTYGIDFGEYRYDVTVNGAGDVPAATAQVTVAKKLS